MIRTALVLALALAAPAFADTSGKRGSVDYRRFVESGAFAAARVWYFTAGGRYLLIPDGRGITLIDTATGKEHGRLDTAEPGLHDSGFSPNGKLMATAYMGAAVKVWNLETLKEVRTFQPFDELT